MEALHISGDQQLLHHVVVHSETIAAQLPCGGWPAKRNQRFTVDAVITAWCSLALQSGLQPEAWSSLAQQKNLHPQAKSYTQPQGSRLRCEYVAVSQQRVYRTFGHESVSSYVA